MSRELEELEVKFAHMHQNVLDGKTFIRSDLNRVLMEEMALTEGEAKVLVQFFLDEIIQGMIYNAKVVIPPLGTFYQSYRPSYHGRQVNPYTREEVYTHHRRTLRFKGSPRLNHRMNTPEKYRDLYPRADEHTLIMEDPEYNLDDPNFKTFDEGLAKGYTEEEIIEELKRQAKESDHYYTLDVEDSE